MGSGSEETFFQRRHIDGQQIHEKTLNIATYQRNATQNHKIVTYTCQNGYHQKVYK